MDGVIIDHSALRIKLASDFGLKLRPEQTPSEIIKTIIPAPILNNVQKLMYNHPQISLSSPLITGVIDALKQIKESGIQYALISRRKDPQIAIKLLQKHAIWPKYLNEKNAFFVLEPEDKNKKALELGITHYIDDEIKILEKLNDVKNKFLFDNFNVFKTEKRFTRVSSWPELIKHLI